MWLGATTLGSTDLKHLGTVPGTVFAAVMMTPLWTVTKRVSSAPGYILVEPAVTRCH